MFLLISKGLIRETNINKYFFSQKINSPFVERMNNLRKYHPINNGLKMNYEDLDNPFFINKSSDCKNIPFIYPALSERPWTGLFDNIKNDNCDYTFYSFDSYFKNKKFNGNNPISLRNMKFLDYKIE